MTSKSQNHNPSGSEPCCQKRQHGPWQARGITYPNSNLQGRTYPERFLCTYFMFTPKITFEFLFFFFFLSSSQITQLQVSQVFMSDARTLSCFSCAQIFVTLRTIAHPAPLSMGFFRHKYVGRLPFLSLFYGPRLQTTKKTNLSFKKFPWTQLLHTNVRDYTEANNELTQGHLP